MDSSASEEADGEGNYVDGRIDLAKLVRAVTNLARSTTDKESIHHIASSIRLNPEEGRERRKTNDKFQTLTRKRHSEDQRAEKDDGNKRARKTVDKNVKSAKGRLVQTEEFECENCERCFGTVTSLKTHKNSCAQGTDALKSTKDKCTLCNKEPKNIYKHYATVHVIEDPEQIMFYKGNKVLVRSHIDTKGGKAPWFQKEEVKAMNKYDSLICRLCVAEPKFRNAEILADHYTLYHMVAPAKLDILKRLFRAEKGAHLVDLPTSHTPSKRKGADSNPTPDKLNSNYDTGKSRWPCKQCKREYSTSGNLARHVKLAHLEKKPAEVVVTKVVSNKNKNKENTSKREAKRVPKSKKPKCVLDGKELTTTHKHNVHNVECREQLFFVNGNNVAISDIDTKGVKDPGFLRETEKAKRYTPTTCRLCETEYDDPAVLENHYRSDHKVVPGALERLQDLAKKGAHLADLPASRAPSKLQKSSLRPPQGEPLSNGYVSAAEDNNQKPEQEIEKQDATINTTLRNVQNNSRMTENSAAGPEQGNTQTIQIVEDTVVSVFCYKCNKSIIYSNFEAHAATHKNNQYVAEEADCSQIIEENTTQEQRSSVSAAEHNNQKPVREIEKQDASTTLQNVRNDSRMTENSAAGPEQGNIQPIETFDIVISVYCDECNKSIMYSNFKAHAATHKNNKYVAVKADCGQIIEENTTQEQRASPGKDHEKSQNDPIETVEGNCDGTVEPSDSDKDSCHGLRTSSYVVQDDVHVERDETEEINHSHQSYSNCSNNIEENCDKAKTTIVETSVICADSTHQEEQNSENNSMAIYQAQDTEEGLEERDAFSKELREELERTLHQALLGDEENGTCE